VRIAVGTKTRVKAVKNNVAPPFREAEFWMIENPQAAEEIRALLVARRKAENAKLGAPPAEAAAA
jgi:RecA/RadA recombinase